MEEFRELTVTIQLTLDEQEQENLSKLIDLRRKLDIVRLGHERSDKWYTEDWLLELAFRRAMSNGLLDDELALQNRILERHQKCEPVPLSDEATPDEAAPGDVPTRNPSSDEATPDEAAPGDVPTRNPSPDEAAPDEAEPETVPNAEEKAPGDRESEPDGEEDFLTLTPLPCSYPHDPTVQYTPYDPVRYGDDAYECGGCVVEDPETLAFVDALTEALCR